MTANYFLAIFLFLSGYNQIEKSNDSPLLVRKCQDFTIDGKGSAAEWNKVEWQKLTKITKNGVDHETKSKMLYSEKGVYVLFSGIDEKVTTKDYKDGEEIYEGDV